MSSLPMIVTWTEGSVGEARVTTQPMSIATSKPNSLSKNSRVSAGRSDFMFGTALLIVTPVFYRRCTDQCLLEWMSAIPVETGIAKSRSVYLLKGFGVLKSAAALRHPGIQCSSLKVLTYARSGDSMFRALAR